MSTTALDEFRRKFKSNLHRMHLPALFQDIHSSSYYVQNDESSENDEFEVERKNQNLILWQEKLIREKKIKALLKDKNDNVEEEKTQIDLKIGEEIM
jgi:hypothetical protein